MYGDVAGFVTYNESRGRSVPATWGTEEITAALLVASEWINNVYGNSFVGRKTGGFLQSDQWPRIGATVYDGNGAFRNYYTFPDNVIPERVKQATYEAAFREITKIGFLQPDYIPNRYKKVSVDGAIAVEYANITSAADVAPGVAIVDTILWPLMDSIGPASFSGLSGPSSRV